jgi:glyoxylase-like metal-dependent hydrolase (beta-lactamase superfamily II)
LRVIPKKFLEEEDKAMKIIPIKLSVTTCYFVHANSHYVLIDTGYEEDWDLFLVQVQKVNIKLSEISHIILTHHHDDHCGLLANILKENPSIQVVMSYLCEDLISVGENDRTHGGGLLNKRVAFLVQLKQFYVSLKLGKKVDKSNNLKFKPYILRGCDIVINGDTELRNIGIPIDGKIIETPGHSVDSVSILFYDGDCIVGDAAASMLKFADLKNCVIFICNMDEYYKSWQKIIVAGAKKIFPAHGKPFSVDKLKKNIGKNKAKDLVPY